MNTRERIGQLEREELRETVARAAESLARMCEQRDILWLFARRCAAWAHTCQCGHRANEAMEKVGLGRQDSADLATGLPLCMCHLIPAKDCPWSGQGVRL